MAVSLFCVLLWLIGGNLGWGGIFELDAVWPGLVSSLIVYVVMTLCAKPTEEDYAKVDLFCKASASGET